MQKQTISQMTPEELIKELTEEQKDYIYRSVRSSFTAEDITSHIEDNYDIDDYDISEEELEAATERAAYAYAFDGDYDCNLDYWQNIENLIEKFCLTDSKRKKASGLDLEMTNSDDLRDKFEEYLRGLKIVGDLTYEDVSKNLDDFDKWLKTAKIGEAYYYDNEIYTLEDHTDEKLEEMMADALYYYGVDGDASEYLPELYKYLPKDKVDEYIFKYDKSRGGIWALTEKQFVEKYRIKEAIEA